MRKILLSALAALLAISCVQDNGNYDYRSGDDVFPVKIEDFTYGETVQTVKQGAHLVLDVAKQVKGAEPGRYTYVWLLQLSTGSTSIIESEVSRSTTTPNLDLDLTAHPINVGPYKIVLEVRDEKLNLFTRSKVVNIEIGAIYGNGWYVLKNTGDGYSNIDFVSSVNNDGSGNKDVETGLDMPQQMNGIIDGGELPQGEALSLVYLPLYAIDRPKLDTEGNPTGTTEYVCYSASGYQMASVRKSNMGAFMVATKSNLWTIDPLDMTPIRTKWEDQFYNTQGLSRNIEAAYGFNTDFTGVQSSGGYMPSMGVTALVVIDGKVHSAYFYMHNRNSATGRFSNAKMEFAGADYHAAPFIPRNESDIDIIFDRVSHSFMWGLGQKYIFQKWASPVVLGSQAAYNYAQPDGMPNLSNMDYDLVWMLDNTRASGAALGALMKSTSGNEYMLLLSTGTSTAMIGAGVLGVTESWVPNTYPFERKVMVDPASKLVSSTSQFMVHSSTNIYFAHENKIYWHLTSGDNVGAEEVLFTLPSDETIAMTKIVRNGTGTCWALTLSNSTSGKWHIRLFKITEGVVPLNSVDIAALNSKPDFHASGDGAAADVTYRGNAYKVYNK